MTLKPWPTYLFIAGLGMAFGIGAATIAISIMWTDLDLPQEEAGSARSEQAAPAPAEQMEPAHTEQLTLAPAVHAAPGGTPEPTPRRTGFKPAVRYEALLPGSNNQAFSNARKERHAESRELLTELLVQLDTLDLQAQFQEGVQLNTEGNFREGHYVRFVFNDAEGQDEAIRNVIRKLRRSSPAGFIHLRAHEMSYRDH